MPIHYMKSWGDTRAVVPVESPSKRASTERTFGHSFRSRVPVPHSDRWRLPPPWSAVPGSTIPGKPLDLHSISGKTKCMVPQNRFRILPRLRALRDLRGLRSIRFTTKGTKKTEEAVANSGCGLWQYVWKSLLRWTAAWAGEKPGRKSRSVPWDLHVAWEKCLTPEGLLNHSFTFRNILFSMLSQKPVQPPLAEPKPVGNPEADLLIPGVVRLHLFFGMIPRTRSTVRSPSGGDTRTIRAQTMSRRGPMVHAPQGPMEPGMRTALSL